MIRSINEWKMMKKKKRRKKMTEKSKNVKDLVSPFFA
jgi:hypothetical protein